MEKIKKSNFFSKSLFTLAAVFLMTLAMGITSEAANAPAQVTGLKQTDAGTNNIKLEWSALLDNGVNYEVHVSTSRNGVYKSMDDATYNNDAWIDKLNAGTTYYAKVRAYVKDEAGNKVLGAFSAPLQLVTAPNSAPSTMKHTKSTTSSISLNWTKVPGANYYIVDYRKYGDDYSNFRTKYTKTNSTTLTKLSKNQRYTLYVYPARKSEKGFVAVGPGKYIMNISVTPGKTGSLYCPLFWQNLGQIKMECADILSADGYQWELYTSYKSKDRKIKTVNSNYSSTYIANSALKKHNFYKVRVRAYCKTSSGKKYYGAWSSFKYICPQPDMKMRNTKSGIAASWDKIAGADQYIVYVSNKQYSGYKKYCTTKKTSVTVKKYGSSKLKSGRKYYMYVVAKNKAGGKYYSGEAGNANRCWYITYKK